MDAALGFHHLGLSHLLEQDYNNGVNYLKVSKGLASSIYSIQRSQGRMDLLVSGVHETKPIPQSIALKLRYYLNAITVCDTKDQVRRRLNGIATLTEKWSQVQYHIYNLTKVRLISEYESLDVMIMYTNFDIRPLLACRIVPLEKSF